MTCSYFVKSIGHPRRPAGRRRRTSHRVEEPFPRIGLLTNAATPPECTTKSADRVRIVHQGQHVRGSRTRKVMNFSLSNGRRVRGQQADLRVVQAGLQVVLAKLDRTGRSGPGFTGTRWTSSPSTLKPGYVVRPAAGRLDVDRDQTGWLAGMICGLNSIVVIAMFTGLSSADVDVDVVHARLAAPGRGPIAARPSVGVPRDGRSDRRTRPEARQRLLTGLQLGVDAGEQDRVGPLQRPRDRLAVGPRLLDVADVGGRRSGRSIRERLAPVGRVDDRHRLPLRQVFQDLQSPPTGLVQGTSTGPGRGSSSSFKPRCRPRSARSGRPGRSPCSGWCRER